MTSQFRNLVFEGGGAKGIAYAGALEVLEQKGVLGGIRRVAGTSAGAITAALLAAGADARQLARILASTDTRRLMDSKFGVLGGAIRLLREFGWYAGDAFTRWMGEQVQALCGDAGITFAGLAERAAAGQGRELYVVGTDLHAWQAVVFSHETTPSTWVVDAVRASMSLPLFFRAVRSAPHLYVDGGVTWNYPIDLFDERRYLENPAAAGALGCLTAEGEPRVFNKETLGLRVDTKEELEMARDGRPLPKRIGNIKDYATALLGFAIDTANSTHLHPHDWHRTVFIDALGVRATDLDLEEARVRALVESGRAGAAGYSDWFEGRRDGAVVPLNRV